jgi:hypothetical protein
MRISRHAVCACVLIACAACQNNEHKPAAKGTEKAAESATASTAPVLNKEIANAVAKASQASQKAQPAEGGPPPNGILGRERADQDFPPGTGAKLELASSGTEPRILLAAPEVPEKVQASLTVSVRTGPVTALPTVTFQLDFGPASSREGIDSVVIDVGAVKLAEQQLGQVPEQLRMEVAKLKGSTFSYQSRKGALIGAPDHGLSKEASDNMGSLLAAGADALSTVLLTVPTEPVGQGAIWMVSNRENLTRSEVVSYNLFKVEEVTPSLVKLSVQTQRYIVDPVLEGNPVVQFKSTGSGEFSLVPGNRLPSQASFRQSFQALLRSENGQRRPTQWDLTADFTYPGAKAAASAASGSSVAPPSSAAIAPAARAASSAGATAP